MPTLEVQTLCSCGFNVMQNLTSTCVWKAQELCTILQIEFLWFPCGYEMYAFCYTLLWEAWKEKWMFTALSQKRPFPLKYIKINPRKWHCVTVFSIHSRLNAVYPRWYRHNQEWEWQFCIRRPSQTIILLSLYSPCCAAASSLDWLDSSTACKWVNSDVAVCVMFCLMYCCAFQVVHT